jgi:hypothetical protein
MMTFLYRNIFLIITLVIGIPLAIFILSSIQNIISSNISIQWNIFLNRNNLSSILIFIQIFVSLSIFATCFGHFKETHVAKQIIVNYQKMRFLWITFLFAFVINIVCTIWGFSWFCIFNYNHIKDILSSYKTNFGNINVDWIGVIISNLLNILLSICFGFLLGLFCNSNMVRTTITCILLGAATLLSGCFIPFVWHHDNDVFNGFSYLSPFRYTNALMQMSWSTTSAYNLTNNVIHNGGIWNANYDYNIFIASNKGNTGIFVAIYAPEIILSWIIPISIICISIILLIYYPRWKKI